MLIRELIKTLEIDGFLGDLNRDVKGISHDSRKVGSGDLFVAIKGFETDGHLFINDVVKKGVSAIMIEDKDIWNQPSFREWVDHGVSLALVSNSRLSISLMADRFYGYPSRHLNLIGVTGTNGKTTTCSLISHILETAGEKVGLITTLNYKIGERLLPADRTTPDSLFLQGLLADALDNGCRWVVLEVSSHSLSLERVAGCWFSAGILTNITKEHLDFHKTMTDYIDAKSRLFMMLDGENQGRAIDKIALFNIDDPNCRHIMERMRSWSLDPSMTISYGIENSANIIASGIEEDSDGLRFTAITPWFDLKIVSPLLGLPNVYNILAAVGTVSAFGLNPKDIIEAIRTFQGVPGRFEQIKLGQDYGVIIDYAHTDDALMNLLFTLKAHTRGRLICVFGCGGDRDRGKRPLMGGVAARYSDWTIITNDNPRGEEPLRIAREIEQGFLAAGPDKGYEILLDRKEAIFKAIGLAKEGDFVVIAGKGHEKTQIIGKEDFPFEDCEIARLAILESMGESV